MKKRLSKKGNRKRKKERRDNPDSDERTVNKIWGKKEKTLCVITLIMKEKII